MESILVLTHTDDSNAALTKPSLEAVTAGYDLAAQLGAALSIGIVASNPTSAAASLASAGARLLAVSGEPFAQPRYATDAAACEALCRAANATIVLAPGTSRFTRVAAGVAHRLGGFIDTHITNLNSLGAPGLDSETWETNNLQGAPGPSPLGTGDHSLQATRWFYRQRIEAVLTRATRPWFLLLDPGTNAPYARGVRPGATRANPSPAPRNSNHRHRPPRPLANSPNHPSRGQTAVSSRRRLDQEAA